MFINYFGTMFLKQDSTKISEQKGETGVMPII